MSALGRGLLATALAGSLSCAPASEPVVVAPPEGWQLVWDEPFDGPEGAPPDPARWTYDTGGHGWGNQQLEYNTNRSANVALDGQGHLLITARRQSIGGNAYTSGRIKTLGLFAQRYGRVEARLKLPAGQGLWPAFWMLGADFPTAGWPDCGEIDILEARGQDTSVLLGSVHGPGYSGGEAISHRYRLSEAEVAAGRLDEAFHDVAVEWDPARIVYLFDGRAYATISADDVLSRGRWVFDKPYFLLLNLAVGGNFVGPPNEETAFPASLVVDHVRVWERTP